MNGSVTYITPFAATKPPAIRMSGVNFVFGGGATQRQVLFNLNLEIARGEIVLLMGPSGCGKTTVLTLVGGLRSMQDGEISTLGIDLADADEATMIAVRRQIGFIYQSHNLHASLTAIENVRMGLEVFGPVAMHQWQARCEDALEDVGILDWADSYPAKLSGGQKQRVAIARALVAEPPLILADEPTAALDGATGRQIVELLRTLAKMRGTTILMVTHDNRILDIADRILEMEDGRVISESSGLTKNDSRKGAFP